MRIAIDMQGAQSESRNRGIGRYTTALTKYIVKHVPQDFEVILILNGAMQLAANDVKKDFKALVTADNIRVWNSQLVGSDSLEKSGKQRAIDELTYESFILAQKPDFLLIASLFEGVAYNDNTVTSIHRFQKTIPVAVVLYDLIPMIHPKIYFQNPMVKDWYFDKISYLKEADLVLSISESSRQEGISLLGLPSEKITNISTDANAEFKPLETLSKLDSTRDKFSLQKPFIMYTGGIDYRKNIDGLIRSYSLLPLEIRKKYQLAIVCAITTENRNSLEKQIQKSGLSNTDVIFTGFVTNEDLIALYSACSLFVFPSHHEGFGLPVLEAMRCGALVLCSNTSSLPEVVGDADATFDPYSDKDIAKAMMRVLTDPSLAKTLKERQQLQAKSFSWEKSAKRAISAMNDYRAKYLTAHENKTDEMVAKPKLAFVLSIPSAKTINTKNCSALVRTLTDYYNIDVIAINCDPIPNSSFERNCDIRTVEYFLSNSETYERVIYHFGHSNYHKYMYSLLKKVQGVVLISDFFISDTQSNEELLSQEETVWTHELLKSHGYQALKDATTQADLNKTVCEYPKNLSLLQQAKGVIFESAHTAKLVEYWYGKQEKDIFNIAPLPLAYPNETDKNKAKAQLGFKNSDLLICTFGPLEPASLNHRLLEAWLSSKLAKIRNAYLVFVCDTDDSLYYQNLKQAILDSQNGSNVKISRELSEDDYKTYLQAADIGVQLQGYSCGDTITPALTCISFGIATIVNAGKSLAVLDENTVIKLSADFSDKELITSLDDLIKNDDKRARLCNTGRQYIETHHAPEPCTRTYYQIIEDYYQESNSTMELLVDKISELKLNKSHLKRCALMLAENFPPKFRKPQLLLDISELVQKDHGTGIQRVTREILVQLLENQPAGFQIEPVYATLDKVGYRYARRFTCSLLDICATDLVDAPVDAWQGDTFIGLDFQTHIVPKQTSLLKAWHSRGVKIWFLLYDLLPIKMKSYFVDDSNVQFKLWLKTISQFDGAACISKTVASEYAEWLNDNNYSESERPKINWFHLGADLNENLQVDIPSEKSLPSQLQGLSDAPIFLMVGTVEPRKGHVEVLAAFEQLWQDGIDANLVIVGKQGWLVEDFVNSLAKHEQSGNKLHWLSSVNDAELKQIYHMSTCLIAASEGEGFGLPLIEASQFKLPIIARDIPVFREVAGKGAFYFTSEGGASLATAVSDWLQLYKENAHPCSTDIEWITWRESASDLLTLIKNS